MTDPEIKWKIMNEDGEKKEGKNEAGKKVKIPFKERVEREKYNEDCIYAYPDGGVFYHLYERSAFLFVSKLKEYHVSVRKVKGLPEPFVYIGFPIKQGDNFFRKYRIEKDMDGRVLVVKVNENIDYYEFRKWKNKVILEDLRARNGGENGGDGGDDGGENGDDMPERKAVIPASDASERHESSDNVALPVIREFVSLNIAEMTPMAALNTLNDFQKKFRVALNK